MTARASTDGRGSRARGPARDPRPAKRAGAVHARHLRRRRSAAPEADAVALPSDGGWPPARRFRRHHRGPRVRWTTRSFRAQVRDALRTFLPDHAGSIPEAGERFASAPALRPGRAGRPGHVRRAPQRLAETDARLPGRQRAPVLPRDSSQPLRGDHQPARRVGHRSAGARSQAAALGADHHREAVRPEPGAAPAR